MKDQQLWYCTICGIDGRTKNHPNPIERMNLVRESHRAYSPDCARDYGTTGVQRVDEEELRGLRARVLNRQPVD